MFRIDDGERTRWPQRTGFRVEGLNLAEKHLVVVYSWGKPIQAFRFRMAEFQDTKLCLLFDGYGGPELRHMHKSCGCSRKRLSIYENSVAAIDYREEFSAVGRVGIKVRLVEGASAKGNADARTIMMLVLIRRTRSLDFSDRRQ
jgi:hypothetical protein